MNDASNNVLILTGIREELSAFMLEHPFEFERTIRAYRSAWYPNVFASTTGPGVRRRKDTRKLIRQVNPGLIINAGIVGVLVDESIGPGEHLKLGSVVDATSGIIFPGGPGRGVLASVSEPVFDAVGKTRLHREFGADFCEMEAAPLLNLVGAIDGFSERVTVLLCKVAGDGPGDERLFAAEEKVRAYDRSHVLKRLWLALRFPGGPRRLRELRESKAMALAGLTRALHQTLKHVLDSGGRTDNLDSIFLPH